jgi:alkylation response protein AidB-like acyl-CoA dehydrogenase
MATRAEATADGFRLDGIKTLVTNAPDADLFLTVAATRPQRGSFGWSAFLVPRDTPGLSVQRLTTAGLAGAPMGQVIFDGCAVPSHALLGAEGAGLRVFTTAMLWERTGILAGFLGAAERDLAACIEYVNAGRGAEGPLAAHQAVAHRIARARLRLDRARLLVLRAAWAVESRHKNGQQAVAMAKHDAAETVVETAMDVLRITAGAGWQNRLGASTALCDTLGTLFASGTSEIQLNIIAASMGLKRR